MLTDDQLKFLEENKVVVLTTSSKENQPRSILVEASKFEADRIIMTDNYMKITRQNLLDNNKVFILCYSQNYERILNIEGQATYETEGENFDFVKNSEQNKDFSPKAAVVVKVTNVTESD